ncbi:SMI1/KNR4 family protein [Streptomyces goshikiensis]
MSDVEQVVSSWTRIARWLQSNAPISAGALGPPATNAEIQHLSHALGFSVPAQLEAWLRLNNGSTAKDSRTPIPGGNALKIDRDAIIFPESGIFLDSKRIADSCQNFLQIAADIADEDWWKPTWIPITGHFDGHAGLILDIGPDGSECQILRYSESNFAKPLSVSLGGVLTGMADVLEMGSSSNSTVQGYRPTVEDGRLLWS